MELDRFEPDFQRDFERKNQKLPSLVWSLKSLSSNFLAFILIIWVPSSHQYYFWRLMQASTLRRKQGLSLRAPLRSLNDKLCRAFGLTAAHHDGLNLAWGMAVASTLVAVAFFYATSVIEPVRVAYCESAAGNCTFFWSLLIDFLIFTLAAALCPATNFMTRTEHRNGLELIQQVDAGLNFSPNFHTIEKVLLFFFVYLSLLILIEIGMNSQGTLEGIMNYTVDNGFIFLSDIYFLVLQVEFFGIAWSFQKRFWAINKSVSLLLVPKWNTIPTILRSAAQETATSRFDRLVDLHWCLSRSVSSINKVYGFKLGMLLFYLFYRLLIIPHIMSILITTSEDGLSMKVWWFFYHVCQLALLVLPAADSAKQAEKLSKTICKVLGTNTHVAHEQMQNALTKLSVHDVTFTAFNIISLQRKLISSIVGAIATYLIVLTQLRSTSISVEEEIDH